MTNPHIIQKQFVEIIANGIGDSFALQKEAEILCKLKLIPGLELLLDKYGNTDEVICIDKLFIEVDNVSLTDFESILAEKVLHQIEDALRERVTAGSTKMNKQGSSIRKREIELLVFYLQKGYLPWWSAVKNNADWQQKLDRLLSPENRDIEWTILHQAFKEQVVRERLLAEFTEQQFWTIIDRISLVDHTILKADLVTFHQHIADKRSYSAFDNTYKDAILRSITQASDLKPVYLLIAEHVVQKIKRESLLLPISRDLVKKIRNKELQILLNQLPSGLVNISTGNLDDKISTDLLEDISKPDKQGEDNKPSHPDPDISNPAFSKEDTLQEEIYIGDSGLTIIAPYLPLFFKNMQLVNKDQINNIPKALALLHYITYGDDDYAGFECVLAKVLCGVSLSAVIPALQISEQEKAAADELLQAVINHWQMLKKTSIAALQTSFLQREGRLSFGNNEWNLKIHNESYDLLLSHLPWNINMIKLPWMNQILKVDWI